MTRAITMPSAAQALPEGDSLAGANAPVNPVCQLAGGGVDLAASALSPIKIHLAAQSIKLTSEEAGQ